MLVKVGVASLILNKDHKILLGLRKGSHGSNTWALPGGHLEFNETPVECAKRETKEEAGIDIINVRPGPWTNDIFTEDNKHYITIFMLADHLSGEPEILEPAKCERWEWFEWKAMPRPLFKPLINLISQDFNPSTFKF